MRQDIINVLSELRPEFDFQEDIDFIEAGILDSLDIVNLITALDEKYNISIDGVDIIPENFSSLTKIEDLLKKNGVK